MFKTVPGKIICVLETSCESFYAALLNLGADEECSTTVRVLFLQSGIKSALI